MISEHPIVSGPICIVDDDEMVCDSVRVLLETYGFTVAAYPSGVEFLADRRHGRATCLIIDQHMPSLNGLDVVAQLRAQGAELPTILITGRLDPAITLRARELGIAAVLEKPFPVSRLLELVRAALALRP